MFRPIGSFTRGLSLNLVKKRLRLAELEAESKFVERKFKLEIVNHNLELAKSKAKMEVLSDFGTNDQPHQVSLLYVKEAPVELQTGTIHPTEPESRDHTRKKPSDVIGDPDVRRKPPDVIGDPQDRNFLIKLVKHQSAPLVDIESFDGDPLQIDYFLAIFKEVVESNIDDPKGRLLRLLKYTTGEAREAIRHCVQLPSDTCYKVAIKLLRKRFGDCHLILSTYRNELRNWQPLKLNDAKGFRQFLNLIVKCQSFVCDDWSILDTPDTICCLVSKLPPPLVDRCNRKVLSHRQRHRTEPKLAEFVPFIEEETILINDPLYSREAVKCIIGAKERSFDKRSLKGSIKNLMIGKEHENPTSSFSSYDKKM